MATDKALRALKSETLAEAQSGSFRDRLSRVYVSEDRVSRGLSQAAQLDWEKLKKSSFFKKFVDQGKLIPTAEIDLQSIPAGSTGHSWVAALSHQRLPFISYPYEWTFGMLQDAAILQLDLLEAALAEDLILKDSTPFNVQWRGTKPVFIDIGSFTAWKPGQIWVGYRQFCELFLYPLMLQAYKLVDFHRLLRSNLEGIDAATMWQLMSLRDLFRSGVLLHVCLQAKFQKSFDDNRVAVRKEIEKSAFGKEMLLTNVRQMRKLIRRLQWPKGGKSTWSEYGSTHSYSSDDHQRKKDFVRKVATAKPRQAAWDIGCNNGVFSQILAEGAEQVLAMDADHATVEHLYQRLKAENNTQITPLVMNAANPSSGQGWKGKERTSLEDRSKPDLVICLALIHHIVISSHIPVSEFIDWLASFGAEVVIEFVTKGDAMVKRLLANKEDIYADYEVAHFEACVAKSFRVAAREELQSGTRIMYHLVLR